MSRDKKQVSTLLDFRCVSNIPKLEVSTVTIMPFLFTVHKNEKKKLAAVQTQMTTTTVIMTTKKMKGTKQKPELKTNKTQEHQEKKRKKREKNQTKGMHSHHRIS